MRSWISATSSLAGVVMIANVRIHSPDVRIFPVLPKAANAERLAVLHGDGIRLLGLLPLMAFHSKKPSTGRMQRRRR